MAVTGLGSLVSPGRVEAGVLRLNMSGTAAIASVGNTTFFPPNTPWSLEADFNTASLAPATAPFFTAPATNLKLVLEGTTYTPNSSDWNVYLGSSASLRFAAGVYQTGGSQLMPVWVNSSNSSWDASSPTPTVFSYFYLFQNDNLTMSTNAGQILLFSTQNVSTSITGASPPAVPEPSLVSLAIGGAAFGLVALRRRARRG